MKTKEEFDLSTYRFEVPDGVFINVKYVKEFIRKLKESIEEIAEETDIWTSARWKNFKRMLRTEINKLAGDELT